MKKRLKSLVLSTTLALALVTNTFAADPAAMTDISGHWAESYIYWVLENDLYNGTSESTFAPNDIMTRSMFVTVLGRLAGINTADYQDSYLNNLYTDVAADAWYAPYVNWATRYGITNGTGEKEFKPDDPVTREQIATLLQRYASNFGFNITTVSDAVIADSFTDSATISSFAASAVESMRITGVFSGKLNDNGTYYFDPLANASRGECAAVFCRIAGVLESDPDRVLVDPTGLELSMTDVTLKLSETTALGATVYPEDASNKTVTWVSSDPSVAKVNVSGEVTAVSEGTAQIYAYTCNGLYAACTVTCEREVSLAYAGESYSEKCIRIFGEVVSDPRTYYTTAEEAESHMVTISVQVWDFSNGIGSEKVTKTKWLQVHENIADTVKQIFAEIYACDAQYPIKSVGGYRANAGKSEHTPGLAIDINPYENYYCYPDGTAITGYYFDPENDPYSIPVDGEIQQIFEKYGFTRGIYWNSGYKDYMHFSFFGT